MKKIKKIIKRFIANLVAFKRRKSEIKKIKQKRRVLIQNSVQLTKEQIKQVQSFYKTNLKKNIPLNWHKNYYAISNNFDYKFFPELYYIPDFERLLNSPKYFDCLQDKNITSLIVKGLDFVKTIDFFVNSSNGILRDCNYNAISLEKALEILNEKKFFIKPTVESCSGNGCRICEIKNGIDIISNEKLEDILMSYGNDFVAQKLVKNCENIARLNRTSLNTFRVITYILDRKIYHMPILMRIGRDGNFLDNAHAGGIFVGVTDEGKLLEYAHSEFGGNFDRHPDTGVIFKDYIINNFEKIIDVSHKLQALFPHVGCINWDLSIDENDNVILIEANMRGGSIWLPQMAHGKGAFGENTARVLEIIRNNKELF